MEATARDNKWIVVICDAGHATLLAVQGRQETARLTASRHFEFDVDTACAAGCLPELTQFVGEQELRGAPVSVMFTGAGTVVQRLQLPPLSARNRARAVRTRLQGYAAGQPQITAHRPNAGPIPGVLAAAVNARLARLWLRACRSARLRPRVMTALAAGVPAPTYGGAVVQLILGERTSTVQLFRAGYLGGARELLLGRRDFVQAYQRPILTEQGPLTLGPDEVEALFAKVGIPLSREDEVRPGIRATQLWPTLEPVLQKLRRELEHSIAHLDLRSGGTLGLSVLALPPVPGLGQALGTELQAELLVSADEAPARLLAALDPDQPATLDLRPPEEQLTHRLTWPAVAAGLAALFVIGSNANQTRTAQAGVTALCATADQLTAQRTITEQACCQAEETYARSVAQVTRDSQLAEKLPPRPAVLAGLKQILANVPPSVRLVEVTFEGAERPARFVVRAAYTGESSASLVAAQWTRLLSETPGLTDARVRNVSGSGRDAPADFVVEVKCP